VARDQVLLIGDAAGLAYAESGEGIRPAIESGLLAAESIVRGESGAGYEARLRGRFGPVRAHGARVRLPPAVMAAAGRELLRLTWFVRRVVLDRWFLHADENALAS
jgi:flavin-dependent dehydrogenase